MRQKKSSQFVYIVIKVDVCCVKLKKQISPAKAGEDYFMSGLGVVAVLAGRVG